MKTANILATVRVQQMGCEFHICANTETVLTFTNVDQVDYGDCMQEMICAADEAIYGIIPQRTCTCERTFRDWNGGRFVQFYVSPCDSRIAISEADDCDLTRQAMNAASDAMHDVVKKWESIAALPHGTVLP